jgi:hypothetical protein
MNQQYLPATAGDDSGWQQTVMAFLAEKERRSGSAGPSRATPGCSGRSWLGSSHRRE